MRRQGRPKIGLWLLALLCAACSNRAVETLLGLSRDTAVVETELEGTWLGSEVRGRSGEFTLLVLGDQLFLSGGGSWFKGTFSLDPQLKHADVRITECDCPYAGEKALAVYTLEEDTLVLAGAEPGRKQRPASLRPDDETRVLRFTRYP